MNGNRILAAAALPVALVAACAGVVSYNHITALGLRTFQGPADSHMLAIPIDGLIVAGSVLLAAGSSLGWLGVALGVAATLFANLQFGLPHGPLSAAVSTWPAVAFTVACFMLERWLRSRRSARPYPPRSAAVPAAPGPYLNGSGLRPAEARPFAEELARGEVPGIRRIRAELHVGQPKAQEIQARLAALAGRE